MIHVENLTKHYGRKVAVDNISFDVARGEIVGFLGPNGAGKTTTMRIMACFLPPTGGVVRIGDCDVFTDSLAVRRKIGYMPEHVVLYPEMRVVEYLLYRGRLKSLRGTQLRVRVEEVIRMCGLTDVRKAVISRLSKGYNQRVGLADALLGDPELLILDEPTIGLDPNQIRQIRNLIGNLATKHTVLLSSHILPEVEMVCKRVLIINKGRIVASDTPGNLVKHLRGRPRFVAEIRGLPAGIDAAIKSIPGVVSTSCTVDGDWNRFVCECESGQDLRADIFRKIASNGWVLRELTEERRNLEDVFIRMTGRDLAAPEPQETPDKEPAAK